MPQLDEEEMDRQLETGRSGSDIGAKQHCNASASSTPRAQPCCDTKYVGQEKSSEAEPSRMNKAEKNVKKNMVPFYKLFSFADAPDVTLMLVGTIAAVLNGCAMPMMTLFVGQMVDSFGRTTNMNEIVREVSKVLVTTKTIKYS